MKYLKKSLFVLLLLTVLVISPKQAKAAEVALTAENFPDKWLLELLSTSEYDVNHDGKLSEKEIKKIKYIDYKVSTGQAITGISGTEHLSSLERITLDNVIADEFAIDTGSLKELFLRHPKIKELKLINSNLQKFGMGHGVYDTVEQYGEYVMKVKKPWADSYISQIEIRGCKQLKSIYHADDTEYYGLPATGAVVSTQRMQITDCNSLEEVSCTRNGLVSLDIKKCPNLKYLECGYNNLTEIKLAQFKKLEILRCNENQIEELDLSANKKIWKLDCYKNQLKNLDVSPCKKLKWLDCSWNVLKTFNCKSCKALEEIWCWDNQLRSLDLSGNNKLKWVTFTENRIKSLKLPDSVFLHLGDNDEVHDRNVSSCIYSSFARNNIDRVDISKLKNLKKLTKSDIKRFLAGDFIRRRLDEFDDPNRYEYEYGDRDLKKRPIKTLVISRKLCAKDRRWIEKQVKKRGIKLIVK